MRTFTTRVDMIKALGGHGVEVGVQRGDFSAEILPYVESLVLVDAWDAAYGDERDPATVRQSEHDRNLDRVRRRFGDDPKAVIVCSPSDRAAQVFRGAIFDWAYIDAGHSYRDVYDDLTAWCPNVHILCGHDYTDSPEALNMGFCVKEAVDAFCRKFNHWELVALTQEQWPSYQLQRK